jgi:tetratricopeptide (TPR) repeat protein
MEAGDTKKAIGYLERAIKLHPGDHESLSMLGRLYALEGQGKKLGLELCRRAVDLDQGNVFCWYQLADLLYALQDDTETGYAIRSGLKIQRNHAGLLLLSAMLEERKGCNAKAASCYRRVLRLHNKVTDVQRREAGSRLLHLK